MIDPKRTIGILGVKLAAASPQMLLSLHGKLSPCNIIDVLTRT